jgi:hypothetical protein
MPREPPVMRAVRPARDKVTEEADCCARVSVMYIVDAIQYGSDGARPATLRVG